MPGLAISARGLGKRYRIGRLESGFRLMHRAARGKRGSGHIWAVRDATFDVPEGSALAIVGSNGAGKSTLLKILARITHPTTGFVDVVGRVGALLEVGIGFSPELTGRENVYMNGLLLGMSRQEVTQRLDQIVDFAGIEEHLDKPVKWYSSGMSARLGFAVAAHLEPDILIVDEVLAVGDLAFQQKCLGRMGEVAGEGRTVLFVSHNLAAVTSFCPTAMYLREGEIETIGPTREVVDRYVDEVQTNARIDLRERVDRDGNGRLRFTDIRIGGGSSIVTGENCEISLDYEGTPGWGEVRVYLALFGALVEPIFQCASDISGDAFGKIEAEGAFTCTIPKLPLAGGHYTITVGCEVDGILADRIHHAATMEVVQGDYFGTGRLPHRDHGAFYVDHTWTSDGATVTPLRLDRSAP